MSLVLGIDTACHVSVGLAKIDDEPVVLAASSIDGNHHVEQLVPLIDQAINDAGIKLSDLDQIAVGLGPGPFTGLRVGIATARVLATTLAVPLRGVCTLDVIAHQHSGCAQEFLVVLDARRKELYWAHYRMSDAIPVRVSGPCVSAPGQLPHLPIVGPGARLYPDVIADRVLNHESLAPGVIARYAASVPDMGVEPLYLRRPDATEPTARKSTLVAKFQEASR